MNETSTPNDEIEARVRSIMNAAWRLPGFCVPNPATYPHQWLWDSCFHTLIWAHLGDRRAAAELEAVLANQASNGFVPHINYWSDSGFAADFWGRGRTSSITQPPMYGHAAAELVRQGFDVPSALLSKIGLAFQHLLLDRRRTATGLVPIFHPWESGCDDSARWDRPGSSFDRQAWKARKAALVESLQFDAEGAPCGNPAFEVGSIGFNALIVFNWSEFCSIPDAGSSLEVAPLQAAASELRDAIAKRWEPAAGTWVDDNPYGTPSCRTADALLALLVDHRDESRRSSVFAQFGPDGGFASQFGVAGVHGNEPSYEPTKYWRGPSWPQLNYLIGVAVDRAGNRLLANEIWAAQKRGALASRFAEFWHPDTGAGLGAVPQSWAGLAVLPAERSERADSVD